MDWFHRITNWTDHNRWTLICLLIASTAMAFLVGCQPKTQSPIDGQAVSIEQFETQVVVGTEQLETRRSSLRAEMAQFNARIDSFNQKVAMGRADLAEQQQVRAEMLAVLGAAASDTLSGRFDPRSFVMPAIGLLGAAFGAGKTLDNRRKDKVIEKLKTS